MTYLELVNATLRRLRRQEVSGIANTDYSKLVGDLVNLAKREVEDAWNWLELMRETSVPIKANISAYTLTGYGERYQIFQVHDTTNQGQVRAIKQRDFRIFNDFPGGSTGLPGYWHISGYSGGAPQIEFWPTPTAVGVTKVYAKVAQADLDNDSDTLTVPTKPVLLGAYVRALDERGEDGGTNSQIARLDYQSALSDAIAQDNANRAHGISTDWYVA